MYGNIEKYEANNASLFPALIDDWIFSLLSFPPLTAGKRK